MTTAARIGPPFFVYWQAELPAFGLQSRAAASKAGEGKPPQGGAVARAALREPQNTKLRGPPGPIASYHTSSGSRAGCSRPPAAACSCRPSRHFTAACVPSQ